MQRALVSALAVIASAAGCSGESGPQPPSPDFSLSVTPASLEAAVGTATASITISVTAGADFVGPATIAIVGVPADVTVSTGTSFSLAAGASQSVTFSLGGSAPVGTTPLI